MKLFRSATTGSDNLNLIFLTVVADFVYYFFLVFLFALWGDRRRRQKRAARIDA